MEERDSFEWNTGFWRGTEHHECLDCAYDTFGADSRPKMLSHCRRMGHGRIVNGAMTDADWIREESQQINRRVGAKVAMAQLCWNTAEVSAEAAAALADECERLRALGSESLLITVDNGSEDDTSSRVVTTLQEKGFTDFIPHRFLWNVGISAARNAMIRVAQLRDAEYVLLIDGDIEPVPFSVYSMMQYLECHKEVGCIGAYSASFTKDRAKVTRALMGITESRVKRDIDVAWTQYGLFRVSMFNAGIMFDVEGPFGEPGWGFEDDDLCLQMHEKGWVNSYFGGMTYLHRNLRSSWEHIENTGRSVERMFNKRKEYVVNKWTKRGYDRAKLHLIGAQQLPR